MSETMPISKKDILKSLTGKIRYRLTNAYLFVAVLQKNRESLCCLIAALLHISREDIISLQILNPIILGEDIGKKDCVLDLLILLNDNTKINLEMQVENEGNWDDRSVYYLARNLSSLESGEDYTNLKKMIQIGILNFNYPEMNQEFYQENLLMNKKTHRVFSDKISINVLCLSQIENATQSDRESGLYNWAKIFKATTWEELKALSENNNIIQQTVVTMAELSEDERIREQCRVREKYELDRINAIHYAERCAAKKALEEGLEKGLEKGRKEGEERFSSLSNKLLASERIDDLKKALSDSDYRAQLYQEFNL